MTTSLVPPAIHNASRSYDTSAVQLNEVCETDFRNTRVQGKGLFDRQPIYAHFTFLDDQGNEKNDLVVVGVHLASGQYHTRNHDRAMLKLVDELDASREDEFCIPKGEYDILIAGDFNANRFDRRKERFWDKMERDGWDVLGDDGSQYPATRLSGHPLQAGRSKIDYIIVAKRIRRFGFGQDGLSGDEITADAPEIPTGRYGETPENFRRKASDHLPVTVDVAVTRDRD